MGHVPAEARRVPDPRMHGFRCFFPARAYTDGYRIAPLLRGKSQDYLGRGELRLGFDLNQRGYAFRSQDAPQRIQAPPPGAKAPNANRRAG